MCCRHTPIDTKGFTLIEALVTSAVIGLVFAGLLAGVDYTLKLMANARAVTSATALANERIEYIKSFNHNDIGTESGIPSGSIPQQSTTTLNNILFHERVLIQNVDAPDDGLGASDGNGILADYKRIKVEYSWNLTGATSSMYVLADVVPPGIESTAGGGTLTVNVFDADVQPVSGAEVRVYNDTTTSTIDVTQFTNTDGVAMFAGAPAASNYEITTTKTGFSTDQTHQATTSNPDPTTPPVSVVESQVSTMNFQIDELSTLEVRTLSAIGTTFFTDDFDDLLKTGSSTSVTLSGGALILGGGVGSYGPTGTVYATATTPTTITAWDSIDWVASTIDSVTSVTVRLYTQTGTSTYALVSDADLPGNATGFTSGPIDISDLDIGAFPTLVLGAELSTIDANVTPELDSWFIAYTSSETFVGSVPFTLTSDKLIGTTPVYKYEVSHTTDGGGTVAIPDLEWDEYTLTLDTASYDIAKACPRNPFVLEPGVSDTLDVVLASPAVHTLRIVVENVDGEPITNAMVDLSRVGFSDSGTTSTCGQVFFNAGLVSDIDYVVDVTVPGYVDQTVTDVNIDNDSVLVVVLADS